MSVLSPSALRDHLAALGVRAKKCLSQNFLTDRNLCQKAISYAAIQEGETVVEIGPGPGALTELLLDAGAHVIAIEMDRIHASHLSRLEGKNRQATLTVHEADALLFPYDSILAPSIKVVASIPYHISTPILTTLLPLGPRVSSITLIVQKEFGERIAAKPGSRAFSSISVFAQFYATAKVPFIIPRSAFFPAPNVDSCVLHLVPHQKRLDVNEELFFKIVRTAFGQRRKMLQRSLRDLAPLDIVMAALLEAGIPSTSRPEELNLEQFAALSHALAHLKLL